MCQTYSTSRAIQGSLKFVSASQYDLLTMLELAKEGIPLPFGNRFWASNWPTHKSPFPALVLHMLISVCLFPYTQSVHASIY